MGYAVKEIFYTLQGEGANAGRPAVFCRFAGCNLWSGREEDRTAAVCRFCDTDFVGTDGVGGGKFSTARELADRVAATWAGRPATKAKPLVVCTGGDDTSQIDRAIKDYNSSPNAATLSFSSGLCGITRPLVPILHGGVIHGDGGVTLVANFAVGNVMTISTEDQVAVRDIRIAAGPGIVRSSGAGLLITANPGKANANPHISSIVLDGMYVGVALERTVSAVVENSVFDNSRFAGLVKANLDSPDVGDDTISNCVFDSSDTAANSTAILQYAGGGLRIHDNKILRHAFGYRLSLAAGARTSDLIISANSF